MICLIDIKKKKTKVLNCKMYSNVSLLLIHCLCELSVILTLFCIKFLPTKLIKQVKTCKFTEITLMLNEGEMV